MKIKKEKVRVAHYSTAHLIMNRKFLPLKMTQKHNEVKIKPKSRRGRVCIKEGKREDEEDEGEEEEEMIKIITNCALTSKSKI